MDERRIQRTGDLLVEYADIETKIMPIIQKCLDNIKAYGKSVNGPQVCKLIKRASIYFIRDIHLIIDNAIKKFRRKTVKTKLGDKMFKEIISIKGQVTRFSCNLQRNHFCNLQLVNLSTLQVTRKIVSCNMA